MDSLGDFDHIPVVNEENKIEMTVTLKSELCTEINN